DRARARSIDAGALDHCAAERRAEYPRRTSTTSAIAIDEPGAASAPQQPARADRGIAGFVWVAEAAGASGSIATAHRLSKRTLAGRDGIRPPGATVTTHASPSTVASMLTVPWGASRITCVPGGAR